MSPASSPTALPPPHSRLRSGLSPRKPLQQPNAGSGSPCPPRGALRCAPSWCRRRRRRKGLTYNRITKTPTCPSGRLRPRDSRTLSSVPHSAPQAFGGAPSLSCGKPRGLRCLSLGLSGLPAGPLGPLQAQLSLQRTLGGSLMPPSRTWEGGTSRRCILTCPQSPGHHPEKHRDHCQRCPPCLRPVKRFEVTVFQDFWHERPLGQSPSGWPGRAGLGVTPARHFSRPPHPPQPRSASTQESCLPGTLPCREGGRAPTGCAGPGGRTPLGLGAPETRACLLRRPSRAAQASRAGEAWASRGRGSRAGRGGGPGSGVRPALMRGQSLICRSMRRHTRLSPRAAPFVRPRPLPARWPRKC